MAILWQGWHIYLLFIFYRFALFQIRLILTNAEGLELYLQIQLNVQVRVRNGSNSTPVNNVNKAWFR